MSFFVELCPKISVPVVFEVLTDVVVWLCNVRAMSETGEMFNYQFVSVLVGCIVLPSFSLDSLIRSRSPDLNWRVNFNI